MDNIIYKTENIDLSGADIQRITLNKCNIITYDDLQYITDIGQLLGEYNAVIILYTTSKNYGHFCSLMLKGGILEFFDPYGYNVDEELKIIDNLHLRKDGITNTPHLTYLIQTSNYKFTYNKLQLQEEEAHVNTCGRWAALRVRLREYNLNTFIKLMTNNKFYNGDFWVSALTLLL